MHPAELTELDAAIIAEEKGWAYLPARDEGYAAVDEYVSGVNVGVPVPMTPPPTPPLATLTPVNRRAMRVRLIREVMPMVKEEVDWQEIVYTLINDEELQRAIPENDKAEEYAMGIVRFCEWAVWRPE